ncbi:Est1 DNA/RNA binding domain-containing protein [Cladophialophora immunda]|nr:Est1 DNA/RNA binding domain-containing protein [Cladophialophora immunda]
MEDIAVQASRNVNRTETDLLQALYRAEPVTQGLESLLAKFRSACQDFLFLDFRAAAGKKVEDRLWNAHMKANSKFRQYLANFREGEGKKKVVERRKAEKLYLEFIKSSQRFYREYIQRLASNYKDISEILEVAQGMKLDTLSADPPQKVDDTLKKLLIDSCYSALVQLGDLSRYRETELQTNRRNWGPAVGYYNKAVALNPTDGRSYNQLAVVALAGEDHLRAVYYFYRAICLDSPAPQAQGNLDLEFKKLRTRSNQGKPISSTASVAEGSRDLHDRFLIFHANCLGEDPRGQKDQQIEILRLLEEQIRERSGDTILRKLVLVNISAEKSASEKVKATRSFEIFQSFNVKTFFLLLRILLDELQKLTGETISNECAAADDLPQVPPVIRRMLPHMRLYSGWLLSTVQLLLENETLVVSLRQMWPLYVNVLNVLMQVFPPKAAPEIQYLLDEDMDTRGLSAFSPLVQRTRLCSRAGPIKMVHNDAVFGTRSPQHEMLYRLKCLITDGVLLARKQDEFKSLPIPLTFANMRFVYLEEGEDVAHVDGQTATLAVPAYAASGEDIRSYIGRTPQHEIPLPQAPSQQAPAFDTENSMASRMENMVDNLMRSEAPRSTNSSGAVMYDVPASMSNAPLVPRGLTNRSTSQSQPVPFTARDLVQRIQQSPSASQPSMVDQAVNVAILPSILNTPFAPRPGETPESSPRPSTAHRFPDPASASVRLNSSAQFQAHLMHMQDQVQMRTSPLESFEPTMSSHYGTPINLTARIRANDPIQPQLSPWQTSFSSAVPVQHTPISTRPPDSSPFGAIGEPRPKSSRTPTSGQPG